MDCRDDFPQLETGIIYFDSAATSLKPRSVIETLSTFYSREYATVHRALYKSSAEATARYSAVRAQVATFLGAASPSEIVFTRGTTDSLNLVAFSYGRAHLQAGDEVIATEMEHHSNLVPWQMLCKEKGAHLKLIPVDERGVLRLERFAELLSPRTKIVTVAHLANSTGTLNPIAKIAAMAHAQGAIVVVDGAQSAAHLTIDVQALGADFFAFSGHKVFGPNGVGVLFGRQELLESMPPIQGGGDMVERVTLQSATYQPPPLRFEAGTPMIAEVMGLGAALTYLKQLGLEQIQAWEQQLLTHATNRLEQIPGLRLIGTAPEKGPILSFTIDGVHPLDLATLLDLQGFAFRTGHLCAQLLLNRFGLSSLCRLSFAPFNTLDEIDRFSISLEGVLEPIRK